MNCFTPLYLYHTHRLAGLQRWGHDTLLSHLHTASQQSSLNKWTLQMERVLIQLCFMFNAHIFLVHLFIPMKLFTVGLNVGSSILSMRKAGFDSETREESFWHLPQGQRRWNSEVWRCSNIDKSYQTLLHHRQGGLWDDGQSHDRL